MIKFFVSNGKSKKRPSGKAQLRIFVLRGNERIAKINVPSQHREFVKGLIDQLNALDCDGDTASKVWHHDCFTVNSIVSQFQAVRLPENRDTVSR